jgi:hypothetical protein
VIAQENTAGYSDHAMVWGLQKRLIGVPSGEQWSIPGYGINGVSNLSLVSGDVFYTPIVVPYGYPTVTHVGGNVFDAATGTATMRVGLYEWDDGFPGALIHDWGTFAITATGTWSINVTDFTLEPGSYFLAVVANAPSGIPQIRQISLSAISSPALPWSSSPGVASDVATLTKSGESAQVSGGLSDPAPAPNGVLISGGPSIWFRTA